MTPGEKIFLLWVLQQSLRDIQETQRWPERKIIQNMQETLAERPL